MVLAILALLGVAMATALLWPDRPIPPPRFDPAALPEDLDGWLAAREGLLEDLTPGTGKRIVWAGPPGQITPLSLVYLHGFSATHREMHPVPERVAAALGANLYLARLAGHGQDGAALARATAEDWLTDLAEAMAIGGRIGSRIVVVGTSTGGSLALAGLGTPDLRAALPHADRVAGLVLVSPNLRLRRAEARLLDLPLARHWGPWVAGAEVGFQPENDDHGRYWTTRYPTVATLPMARLMRAARAVDPAGIGVPLLLIQSPDDRVVDPGAALSMADRWGGTVERMEPRAGPGVDPHAHVPGGDILSPALTGPVSARISDWAGGL